MSLTFLVVVAVVLTTACGESESPGPIEKRPLAQMNPTSYVFARPLADLRRDILTAFGDFDQRLAFSNAVSVSSFLISVDTPEDVPPPARHLFADPANANDLFIHSWATPINPPSPVYYSRGTPLEYFADFHIHFESVDDKNTRVTVNAFTPRVVNGSECCGPHGKVAIFQEVEPTSIEEYRLLEWIGRITGTKGMPPINLPQRN